MSVLTKLLKQKKSAAPAPTVPPPATVDRNRPSDEVSVKWNVIPAAESADHPTLIGEILRAEVDGITITGVFSPEEVDRALEHFSGTEALRTESPIGSLLGMPIGEVGGESQDRRALFDNADFSRALYRDGFGFDPHQRIAEVLEPMSESVPMLAPVEGDRTYNPGHVRWFEPGHGGLRAHAGREFGRLLKQGGMSHLYETTRVEEHLSYFVLLQRPRVGGSLSVFDLTLEEYNGEASGWENGTRDDSYFDTVPRLKVDPAPGDMVLFGGGWRWHRIEPIEGPLPRITYGGFCALSQDRSEMHFWC